MVKEHLLSSHLNPSPQSEKGDAEASLADGSLQMQI